MNNFKHQTPNAKHQQTSNIQTSKAEVIRNPVVEGWCLKVLWCLVFGVWCFSAPAATYEVGPNKKLTSLSEVPWESLNAGDEVRIFWRAQAYKEKFVLCRQGRADAPIAIRGVAGPNGELPVIDGENATTRKSLRYWGDIRGVIKIGGATVPADTMPQHIIIENLDIRGGRPPFSFKAADGTEKTYMRNAAALYVEKAQHLVIRNCILRDSANGLFVSSNNDRASANILVEGSHIHDNGDRHGSAHNVYTAARGIIFQHNRIGPLKTNAIANNIKDRSSDTIIRYNWIEGGDNILDLVDAEDSVLIRQDPRYGKAFVYGNVIIKQPGTAHGYVVHWGGDSQRASYYRKGPLYFFNNTVISYRPNWLLFRFSRNEEIADCRNNIFYSVPPKRGKPLFVFSNNLGSISLSHNWVSEAMKLCANGKLKCGVVDDGTSISGLAPGFANEVNRDFRLAGSSRCINAATNLPKDVLTEHHLSREYGSGRVQERPKDGKLDIGAFEFKK